MNVFSEYLASTILIFIGFRILYYDLVDFSDQNAIRIGAMTKIVAIYCLLSSFLVIFCENPLLLLLFLISVTSLLLRLYVFLHRKRLHWRLEAMVLPFVDRLLLYIRAGHSLNSATTQCLETFDGDISKRFQLILRQEARSFALKHSSVLYEFIEIYFYLMNNKHQMTSVLVNFRQSLQLRKRFQLNFRRGMANIFIQIGVLLCLYISALVFQIGYNYSEQTRLCVLVSMLMVILGMCLFILLQRSFKWTA